MAMTEAGAGSGRVAAGVARATGITVVLTAAAMEVAALASGTEGWVAVCGGAATAAIEKVAERVEAVRSAAPSVERAASL
jgi:hypothetical protein